MPAAPRSLRSLALAVLLALSLPLTAAGADDDASDGAGSDPWSGIVDVFDQVIEMGRERGAQSRRGDRLCRSLEPGAGAALACRYLLSYEHMEQALAEAARHVQGYAAELASIRERASATSGSEDQRLAALGELQRRACGEWLSVRRGLTSVRQRLDRQDEARRHLGRWLGSLGPAAEFGEVRELLDEIDAARVEAGLARIDDLRTSMATLDDGVTDVCDSIERQIDTKPGPTQEAAAGAAWRLVDPKPEAQVIDLVTGFEGILDPDSPESQLYVTYTSEWLDEDLQREEVLYEIEGSFTPPPARLHAGERLRWTVSARISGTGAAPYRLFMCFSARGIPGALSARCAIVGLPADRFDTQSEETDVRFDVPMPSGENERLVITVNAGTLAAPLRYIYEPAP
jgi:hypothetical protein